MFAIKSNQTRPHEEADSFTLLERQYHHHHGTAQGIMPTTSLPCNYFNYRLILQGRISDRPKRDFAASAESEAPAIPLVEASAKY